MSCMEHICRECGNQWFNNDPHAVCARCTSTNVAHFFDEDDDGDDDFWGEDDE